ncbi:Protein of unknown function DUF952 [Dillenia turbinata]|uniref:Uncharacterized protein n=1 Tax=Dillenia turbinata TaxID=194707 RepID=A0AAN8VLF0_9MAGN
MASTAEEQGSESETKEFAYRICTAEELQQLHSSGSTFGGQLDKDCGFIHLSTLSLSLSLSNLVKVVLQNFFVNSDKELYLLQIDSKKPYLLRYILVLSAYFVTWGRSFIPLPLDAVTNAEKLNRSAGQFHWSVLV